MEGDEEVDIDGWGRCFDGNVDERFRESSSEGRGIVDGR